MNQLVFSILFQNGFNGKLCKTFLCSHFLNLTRQFGYLLLVPLFQLVSRTFLCCQVNTYRRTSFKHYILLSCQSIGISHLLCQVLHALLKVFHNRSTVLPYRNPVVRVLVAFLFEQVKSVVGFQYGVCLPFLLVHELLFSGQLLLLIGIYLAFESLSVSLGFLFEFLIFLCGLLQGIVQVTEVADFLVSIKENLSINIVNLQITGKFRKMSLPARHTCECILHLSDCIFGLNRQILGNIRRPQRLKVNRFVRNELIGNFIHLFFLEHFTQEISVTLDFPFFYFFIVEFCVLRYLCRVNSVCRFLKCFTGFIPPVGILF